MPSAFEMSLSVAFSLSLTLVPPIPAKPPSDAASATRPLIARNHVLKAAASFGALESRISETCLKFSRQRLATSLCFDPASVFFRDFDVAWCDPRLIQSRPRRP